MLFDKIFYINLDRRPDRDANVKKISRTLTSVPVAKGTLNLSMIRVPAVDGSKLNLATISRDIIQDSGIQDALNRNQKVYVPLTPGAIGCAMSHRAVWKTIVDKNIPRALILEDDIKIDPLFHQKLETYKKYWPENYDMIFLGYHPSTYRSSDYLVPINELFIKTNKVYGLFGYIVSWRGAQKLLNIFPIKLQIDTEIHKNFHTIDAYLVKPNHRIIFSDPSENSKEFGTDIQKREKNYYSHAFEAFGEPMTFSSWNVSARTHVCKRDDYQDDTLLTIILLAILLLMSLSIGFIFIRIRNSPENQTL
jgi:GR25 family glycosyltransferase involved in LPS biosynthesis